MDEFSPTEPEPEAEDLLSFQDQLVQILAPMDAKIRKLESTLHESFLLRESAHQSVTKELSDRFQKAQSRMPTVRNSVVALSRRIQALSLSSRATTALTAPKQIKPIQDDFLQLKDELDESLRNIATLAKDLETKIDARIPITNKQNTGNTDIEEQLHDIRAMNDQNWHTLENLRFLAQLRTSSVGTGQKNDLNQYLTEAERLVDELDETSEKGLATTQAAIAKMGEDVFTARKSFGESIEKIDRELNAELDSLHEKVREASKGGVSEVDGLHESMMKELEELTKDSQGMKCLSMLEKLEIRNECEEVEKLMQELEILERKAMEIGEDYEVFTSKRGGRVQRFKCYRNGFFEIL